MNLDCQKKSTRLKPERNFLVESLAFRLSEVFNKNRRRESTRDCKFSKEIFNDCTTYSIQRLKTRETTVNLVFSGLDLEPKFCSIYNNKILRLLVIA